MIDHFAQPTEGDRIVGMRRVDHRQAYETLPRVLVIEHEPAAGPGRVGQWLSADGVVLQICRPYEGESIPQRVDADGLLVLGGSVGPQNDQVAPWLPATRALLRRAVLDAVPTWGICLGGQLLATALGGDVRTGVSGPEVGVLALHIDAGDDPVFGGLPATACALQFHQEAVTCLPEGAVRLASSSAYENQAFRVGSNAWAVQFHPEATTEDVRVWARDDFYLVTRGGRESDQVVAELAARQDELEETWAPVTRRWAAQVRKRAAQRLSRPADG